VSHFENGGDLGVNSGMRGQNYKKIWGSGGASPVA
jgi:hypothetical protein